MHVCILHVRTLYLIVVSYRFMTETFRPPNAMTLTALNIQDTPNTAPLVLGTAQIRNTLKEESNKLTTVKGGKG